MYRALAETPAASSAGHVRSRVLELDPAGRARTQERVAAPKIMAVMAHQKSCMRLVRRSRHVSGNNRRVLKRTQPLSVAIAASRSASAAVLLPCCCCRAGASRTSYPALVLRTELALQFRPSGFDPWRRRTPPVPAVRRLRGSAARHTVQAVPPIISVSRSGCGARLARCSAACA